MKRVFFVFLTLAVLTAGIFAEGQGEVSADGKATITVLTNRTDRVDTTFPQYVADFNKVYPNIEVVFESMTDYQGQTKIRMNTEDYGDVLLIPDDVPVQDLPDFFEPLGTVDEMEKEWIGVNEAEKAYDGITYGIPNMVNAQGIVYNKEVFKEAGISKLPSTPEEFLEAMRAIKENTDAIPYYTNYAAQWALNQWESHRSSVAGDPDYVNSLAHMDDPFAPGRPHYIVYKLMYDLVEQGLTEEDYTTTDWEGSKPMIASGQIGAMVLGSWAIGQMQAFAEDPNVIGYMPFPYTNEDGNIYAAAGGDLKMGISKYSKNKEAAKKWLYWFLGESSWAKDEGGIPPKRGAEMPETLKDYQELGVELVFNNPAPAGEEGWVDAIDLEAEIGFWQPNFKARIIEAAAGSRDETFDEICADLNADWAEARAVIVK